jgi:hypothetical protein
LKSLDDLLRDFARNVIAASPDSVDATNEITLTLWNAFQRGDDHQALSILERARERLPALVDDPRYSVFKALLLQRLGRKEEADRELARPCNDDLTPAYAAVRARFLIGMNKGREAEALLSRMILAVPKDDDEYGAGTIPLLGIRAEIRASMGDFAGVETDRKTAESRIPPEPPDGKGVDLDVDHYSQRCQRTTIREAWDAIEAA